MSKLFVTHDSTYEGDPISFNIIEDEDGDVFWGYGHQRAEEFLGEINRWLVHVGLDDPENELVSLAAHGRSVNHLWARMKDASDERFDLVKSVYDRLDDCFPVTRLVL